MPDRSQRPPTSTSRFSSVLVNPLKEPSMKLGRYSQWIFKQLDLLYVYENKKIFFNVRMKVNQQKRPID